MFCHCISPTEIHPLTSKHNGIGHDFCFNLSPEVVAASKILNAEKHITPAQSRLGAPIELPGSLLLPSQGFLQSNPPAVPRRQPPERSQSEPSVTDISRTSPVFHRPFKPGGMSKESYQCSNTRSAALKTPEGQRPPPPPKPPLPLTLAEPRQPPPPIPLSQMTMEELLQILPKLDAAVIAHDWIPCMQKQQHELKVWLENNQSINAPAQTPETLNKDMRDTMAELADHAQTYLALFDVAKELQNDDLRKKSAEVDKAISHKTEAVIALARHVAMHKDKCNHYERQLRELEDKKDQSIDLLSCFIRRHLDEAMRNAPQEEIKNVLDVLVENNSSTNYSLTHVCSDLYEDIRRALSRANNERDGLREVCSQQMAAMSRQSQEMDQYVAKIGKLIKDLQEKERQNNKLKENVAELNCSRETRNKAVEAERQQHHKQELSPSTEAEVQNLNGLMYDEISQRGAEIKNLRRKLEKSHIREKELKLELRQLLQIPRTECAEKQPGRLKRLLGGQQRSNPTIPTINSMHNLSYASFPSFQREKQLDSRDPTSSTTNTGRTSPSLFTLSDTATDYDQSQLSVSQKAHNRDGSPSNFPPRVRDVIPYPQDAEINSAVSGRFHQNVRSTICTSRPHTPRSSSQSSTDEAPQHHRQQPRLGSDSGYVELGITTPRLDRFAEDRQPLIQHNRVLSGITEVTEEPGSLKRGSGSPDSVDRRMYMESMHAANALRRLQVG